MQKILFDTHSTRGGPGDRTSSPERVVIVESSRPTFELAVTEVVLQGGMGKYKKRARSDVQTPQLTPHSALILQELANPFPLQVTDPSGLSLRCKEYVNLRR